MSNVHSAVRAAVVQTASSDDVAENLAQAERLVRQAADQGATVVVLPEKWNVIDTDDRQTSRAEALDGPSIRAASGWARDLGITLVAGSVSERIDGDSRAANTCVVIAPDGRQVATYRKIHLFDVTVGEHQYRESAGTLPGEDVVTVDVADHRLGLAICYDLRFPELFRALSARGANILAACGVHGTDRRGPLGDSRPGTCHRGPRRSCWPPARWACTPPEPHPLGTA